MRMMLLIVTSTISSCTLNYDITINENDRVFGSTDAIYILEDRYEPNLKVTEIDGITTFEFNKVDSLGYYLPYYKYDYFDFEMIHDTLSIRDRNPENVDSLVWHNVIFTFHTFDSIKEFHSNTRFIKQVDDHKFTIRKSIRHFIKGKKVLDGKVVFSNSKEIPPSENPYRTYGLYLDHSTYIELKLYEDYTYEYNDSFELGSTYKFNGTWRMENNKVILSTPDKDSLGSLHTKWILKENTLHGYAQSRIPGKKRYKVELTRK